MRVSEDVRGLWAEVIHRDKETKGVEDHDVAMHRTRLKISQKLNPMKISRQHNFVGNKEEKESSVNEAITPRIQNYKISHSSVLFQEEVYTSDVPPDRGKTN